MTEVIGIDELAIPEAVLRYTVEKVERQPDIGIFHAYHDVTATVVSWSVGGLKLPRRDLVTAIGAHVVDVIEDSAAARHAQLLDDGHGSQCDARHDTLQEARS